MADSLCIFRVSKMASRVGQFLASICLISTLLGAEASAAEVYTLNSFDKIRIGIVDWFPISGDLRPPISGEFVIGSSGTVSLPLIGDTPAAGTTPAELANLISDRLQAKLRLERKLNTSVEVIQFLPFYVIGGVERPGEFTFRPSLTVVQALSLAGGLQRLPQDPGLLQLRRDAATAREEQSVLADTMDAHSARQARLTGELGQANTIRFPPDLLGRKSLPHVAEALRLEESLFQSRRRLHETGVDAQKKLAALLGGELQSLQTRMASLKKEREVMERQLETLQGLEAKGLATPGRLLDTVRAVAEISGRMRELDVQGLRVQQERVRLEEALARAADQRQHDVGVELQAVKSKLVELRARLETNKQLIATAEQMKSREDGEAHFVLIRYSHGNPEMITDVSEDTLLRPGDVLKVQPGAKPRLEVSKATSSGLGTRLP